MIRATIGMISFFFPAFFVLAQMPTAPGIHQLMMADTGQRYTLSIPEGFDSQSPAPLVLSLHYGGRVTPFFGRGLLEALVEPALRDLGALIVAPDNIAGGWANEESERQLLDLLNHIESSYNVDRKKTLITGYSMGAAGTWYMAPRHPKRFAAALPMAGRPPSDIRRFDWSIPIYVIHSTADELIPFEPATRTVDELRTIGASVELRLIDRITHYQMALYRPHLSAAIPWIKRAWSD